MVKKFSLLLAAAAVLAFAVPALANAATGLKTTEPAGSTVNVPVGTLITGTSIGTTTFETNKIGKISCTNEPEKKGKVMVEGKVSVNSSTEVAATEGASYPASCENSEKVAVELEFTKLISLKTNGGGTGTGNVEFALKFPSGLTCTVKSPTAGNTGTYNVNGITGTGKGDDVIKITNQTLNVTPTSTCGSTGTLNAEFTIETKGGNPVYLL